MGVVFRRTDEESSGWNDYRQGKDDESIFQDAIAEIQSILTSSEFEKESFETKTIRFEMDIIKSEKDLAMERCELYNRYSKNKKFTVFQEGEEWLCRCDNFMDGVDLIIENNRISLNFNFEEYRILDMYENLKTKHYHRNGNYRIVECFRMFWTYHKSSPKLYANAKHQIWGYPTDSNEFLEGYFKGLTEIFKILKPEILRTKV